MSFTIPTQIEKDILSGKAVFKSFQIGYGGQSVLRVDANSYIVIYGYEFSPAGNGLSYNGPIDLTQSPWALPAPIAWFGTQQVAFYNQQDFFPYLHNVPILFNDVPLDQQFVTRTWFVSCEPISRQLYITSDKDVSISVGLALQGNQIQTNATPGTGNTPFAISYGGSGQNNNAEMQLNLAGTRNYVQPDLPTDIYGFTPINNNNSNELYWFPDTAFGVIDPMLHIQNVWDPLIDDASNLALSNYKLCVHYALYS